MKNILVVDDNAFVAEALALRLNFFIEDSRVITAADGAQAVEVLNRETVDHVLTDLQMPVMDGFELIEYCRKHHPRVPLAVMTGERTPETLKRIRMLGVSDCFEKPFDFDEVAQHIRDDLDSGRGVIDMVSGGITAAMNAIRR